MPHFIFWDLLIYNIRIKGIKSNKETEGILIEKYKK